MNSSTGVIGYDGRITNIGFGITGVQVANMAHCQFRKISGKDFFGADNGDGEIFIE
ncbi:hypothetical protein [Escherichia coli]|nr:hypothetical protein [Escherichia coli]HCP5812447.1 hypothetical protein [Escherichia coli]HCP5903548.1 hypothetical protein [Escherichia coli]